MPPAFESAAGLSSKAKAWMEMQSNPYSREVTRTVAVASPLRAGSPRNDETATFSGAAGCAPTPHRHDEYQISDEWF